MSDEDLPISEEARSAFESAYRSSEIAKARLNVFEDFGILATIFLCWAIQFTWHRPWISVPVAIAFYVIRRRPFDQACKAAEDMMFRAIHGDRKRVPQSPPE